jgi:general secretion pathway protein D
MKINILLACVLVLAGCSTNPTALDEARKLAATGRGEEALVRLEQAMKENPADHVLRRDYFRQREVLTSQWLFQAEALRLAGQLENAETLYRRVLKHDSGNIRATAGVEQIATDRRHLDIVAAVDKLIRTERYREAEDMLRSVLAENPQQRDARRLQRFIDEKLAKPAVAPVRLRPTKPITLELRDVPLRAVFEVL